MKERLELFLGDVCFLEKPIDDFCPCRRIYFSPEILFSSQFIVQQLGSTSGKR